MPDFCRCNRRGPFGPSAVSVGSDNESGVNSRVVLLKYELIVSVDKLANNGVILPAQAIVWGLVVPIVS